MKTDIASCFEEIPHDRLMTVIEERVCDRHILKLLRAILRVGVMEEGMVRRHETGTPQGGVISSLLANVYLNQLDRAWQRRGCGVLCRYADDARWPSRKAMQAARDRIRDLTSRKRLLLTVEEVVEDVNLFLRSWGGYFRYGNSARHFHKIIQFTI